MRRLVWPGERSKKLCHHRADNDYCSLTLLFNGKWVKRITFEPATNQEFAEVKALGEKAVAPLARYLDLQQKNGFTQLYAVKFLMAIGGPSTLGPLKRALAQDQWDVTRAAALDGIFAVSPAEARPYVKAALSDSSQLVRLRAYEVSNLYARQNK